jgi:ABC-2 type transport system ATP-binding protein
MHSEAAIAARQLSKSFDGKPAVKGCSIEVKKGTIYGLLGANGAGKTTIFKMLSGLLTPTFGSAEILGLDIVKSRTAIQRKIGTMIDVPVFYEDLSAVDNLELHLAYMGKTADVGKTLEMVGLTDTGNRPASKFSLGMRQRLAIARAVVHGPKLLILDEPTNGLDPEGIRAMRKLFVQLVTERGMTILISSHILSEMEHVADEIGLIAKGEMVQEGSMEEIKSNYSGGLEDYYMNVIGG